MKCPYRIDSQYPYVEGENWTYQRRWDDCVPDCPFLVNSACVRVDATKAQKAYYEAALVTDAAERAFYIAGAAYFSAATEPAENTAEFRETLLEAIRSTHPNIFDDLPPEE